MLQGLTEEVVGDGCSRLDAGWHRGGPRGMTLGGNTWCTDQENTCHRIPSQHRVMPAAAPLSCLLELVQKRPQPKENKPARAPHLRRACAGSGAGFTAQEDLPSHCAAVIPGCQGWACGSCSPGCLPVPARSPARSGWWAGVQQPQRSQGKLGGNQKRCWMA